MGGQHKAFLEVDGRTIADRTVALFQELFAEILVASDRPEPWERFPVRVVSDPIRGAGPLAGIAAGLAAARGSLVFVAAGDMPALSRDVVSNLVARARELPETVVVPRLEGRPEPLHAVYPTSLAGVTHRALLDGTRKVTDVLANARVAWVDFDELSTLPGADRTFLNVNRLEDLARLDPSAP
jgi:molybdopterin-guanine dinucleotide biosynthesis protein A